VLDRGSRLLHYELTEKIGQGGMGEVWRALDTTLGRSVALKILPDAFARDAERMARFEREARLLASVRHSGIAVVHGFHRDGDVAFLTMELVDGEDLAARLQRGALPLDEALDVARQVAEALEAAHEQGVVHRDLKPANVRISPEGRAKLLDFGLAKSVVQESSGSGANPTLSPTITAATAAGSILGTAAYMSPEQARGKPVDRRADLWAFGCVLYEMLTGRRVFEGETTTDVLAAVITRDPDWSALHGTTPAGVRRLLRRCLEKDPRRRLRDAGDARWMLDELAEEGASPAALIPVAAGKPGAARRWLPWALTLALAAMVVTLMATGGRGGASTGTTGPVRLSLRVPSNVRLQLDANVEEQGILAVSPDGAQIVFVAVAGGERRLMMRRLDGYDARVMEGTEGANSPFFSPDGRWVGFFSRGRLRKASLSGGPPVDLCESGLSRGGTWGPDGTIVFSPSSSSPLMKVSAEGGAVTELTQLDAGRNERTHRWPSFMAEGEEVLFTVGTRAKPGDYDDSDIDAVSLKTGKRRTLLRGASMARSIPGNLLLAGRSGRVFLHDPRVDGVEATQGKSPVLDGVASIPASGILHFDVSPGGTLVYAEADPGATQYELCWMTRDGRAETLNVPAREYRIPRLSPDGRRLAVSVGPGRGRDSQIWVHDLARGSSTRLTFNEIASSPVWTPDGLNVTFDLSGTVNAVGWRAADGSKGVETIMTFEDQGPHSILDWTPDRRQLVFMKDGGPGRQMDVMRLSLEDHRIEPVAATPAVEWGAALSPDGKWIAYGSDELGHPSVYVQPFPGAGGRWEVAERGSFPRWSRDGSELFYVDATSMMVMPVETKSGFRYGQARRLFDLVMQPANELMANYDLAPDGRLLMIRKTSTVTMTEHINVVLNWFDELRRASGRS
jgi:Tol biopolymer transport system component